MKAKVKTEREKYVQLQKDEILRINKLWLFSLNQLYGFGQKRLFDIYQEICAQSKEVYENPEMWYYIDKTLIEKYGMSGIFKAENIDEREEVSKEKHKENGRKWRKY